MMRLQRTIGYFLYFLLLSVRRPLASLLRTVGGVFFLMFLLLFYYTLFGELATPPPLYVTVLFGLIGFGFPWLAWLLNILCLRLNPHTGLVLFFDD